MRLFAKKRRDVSVARRKQARELRNWRLSAQRVTRTWNAWIAAEHNERPMRYHAYVMALAEEELAAAAVERMVRLGKVEQLRRA
ncbi:MAG TPA: hypothetical protein VGI67_01835 [Thermoleophilaceae bacterium]